MRTRNILATLLLVTAGLQTVEAQGFRVYQSDGTQLQFSMKTDSIVFDNGLSGDEVFGPFTPVNQCIVGTWHKSKSESYTFSANGTTNYMEGATYEFMPYQGTIVIYNASGIPMNYLKVLKVTDEQLLIGSSDGSTVSVWGTTVPAQLVTSIVLSETALNLQVDETKRLTATVLPEDADNPEVTWESSDENVAEVNSRGSVTANGDGTCIITCRATDGSSVFAECQVTVGGTPPAQEHEYVDLGLPSGTLWATCNVGANSPEEVGDYFAWGETTTKEEYSWDDYEHGYGNDALKKYCTHSEYGYNGFTDGKTELDPEDDAATANWGSDWQMPSIKQMEELINDSYTTTEWTQLNGVNGRKITSKSNHKSIFMPAAGYRKGGLHTGSTEYGNYWSRALGSRESSAKVLFFGTEFYGINCNVDNLRCYGQCVRPVRKQ